MTLDQCNMIKKFENFEAKMDYSDLVNILTDFEEFDLIIDKLLWKKLVDGWIYGDDSDELTSSNFEEMTSQNGYILISIQKRKNNLNSGSLTDLLSTFCSRIGELDWMALQYNFRYKRPFNYL